ncbi:hypothetical protein ACN23B_17665 [Anabaena sp. FACHB-709]|uniref:Uncharacterized protein n=2 Tax=Nostocaceae TaxID=1162 RepID=A0A1Z4KJJ2_ANAVA|nr:MULTISPECIES: hypothetical protein [Nostocaceae]BAY69145.1 hypothetical protein NIES23_19370 [Trichormus variabilis NIES-23]MBD2174259.1 hypothetical protein [Anabaena cylindrica FACHB-318]MBD2263634.1 hypothetical protein [Anabaena sp. FACHB-709]MBD2275925.1 hypothetical protein [Nostoc sp. PCC 7120 = FACHB-418]MBD2286656.1 hypothetical protein [Anabaena cylindrica FACHB-170]
MTIHPSGDARSSLRDAARTLTPVAPLGKGLRQHGETPYVPVTGSQLKTDQM